MVIATSVKPDGTGPSEPWVAGEPYEPLLAPASQRGLVVSVGYLTFLVSWAISVTWSLYDRPVLDVLYTDCGNAGSYIPPLLSKGQRDKAMWALACAKFSTVGVT